ncbi:MAG: ATP-binding cassette domain-containing protein [Myxococcales bacterium]|nr:ATP-binding cassette domain-containing protein [Myxococcales bacterium]
MSAVDAEGAARTLAPMQPGLYLITGPNGSGKSQRARTLAERTEGAQLLSPESQQAFYEAELARDDSDFHGGADPGHTVRQLLGPDGAAHPLCSTFRLTPLLDHGYRTLSTGESRKALILRALVQRPTLLVLDEPFEGLDRAACRDLGQALAQVAASIAVVLAGALEGDGPGDGSAVPPDLVREVTALDRAPTPGHVVFRGSLAAFRAHAGGLRAVRPAPPVQDGPWHAADAALDPAIPLIALRAGRVAYGGQPVFEGLDFTLRAGEHTLLEGPNGSGKSTLLELFTGDHPQAYANDLTLFGRKRGTGESVWDIKRRVGLVSGRLHRDYRVAASVDTVLLSGLYDSIGLYDAPGPSARARARAWLRWLDLGLHGDDAFRELSFGTQRLVLIARAAIKVPPLVVLDEPTAGLDADNRAHALELVRSLCTQTASTLLFVTHRPDERDWWLREVGGPRLSLGGTALPDA